MRREVTRSGWKPHVHTSRFDVSASCTHRLPSPTSANSVNHPHILCLSPQGQFSFRKMWIEKHVDHFSGRDKLWVTPNVCTCGRSSSSTSTNSAEPALDPRSQPETTPLHTKSRASGFLPFCRSQLPDWRSGVLWWAVPTIAPTYQYGQSIYDGYGLSKRVVGSQGEAFMQFSFSWLGLIPPGTANSETIAERLVSGG